MLRGQPWSISDCFNPRGMLPKLYRRSINEMLTSCTVTLRRAVSSIDQWIVIQNWVYYLLDTLILRILFYIRIRNNYLGGRTITLAKFDSLTLRSQQLLEFNWECVQKPYNTYDVCITVFTCSVYRAAILVFFYVLTFAFALCSFFILVWLFDHTEASCQWNQLITFHS